MLSGLFYFYKTYENNYTVNADFNVRNFSCRAGVNAHF
jgi:hypothetical protein